MNVRARLGLAAVAAVASVTMVAAQPASADPVIPLSFDLSGSTYVKKLDQTFTIPDGATMIGEADLGDSTFTADTNIPPITDTILVLGLYPMEAEMKIVPTAPSTGSFDLDAGTVSGTTTFDLQITRATVQILFAKITLTFDNCKTSSPIAADFVNTTPLDLVGGFDVSGTFTIPQFSGCGLLAGPLLNAMVPGPDNTLDLTLAPPA